MSIVNNEIVQNSKSEPKKFSFLCTFNDRGVGGVGARGAKSYDRDKAGPCIIHSILSKEAKEVDTRLLRTFASFIKKQTEYGRGRQLN